MATIDPTQAVQTGIANLLRSDSETMQYVSVVLDEIPELNARQYPFIAIPDLTSVFDGTHDDPGRRVTARIHTYVRGDVRDGNSRLDNNIGARIMALLDRAHNTLDPFVEGHTVWMTRHRESRKVNDQDRSVRHRVDTVDIWTTNS